MKKILTSILICTFAMAGFAQKADDICGIFHSVDPFSKEGSQCEIYKAADGTYEAKVVWVENPKKKPQLGLVFMTKLVYDPEAKEYKKGKLKYPGKAGTYSTYIRMAADKNTLHMRGYLGASFLGKTVDWHRESKVRVQK